MSIPFLDVRAGNDELRDELRDAYERVVASGTYVLGAELEAFEQEFAESSACQHAVGVGNGLDALAIALRARGIGTGDEVIVPAHTFIATWLAVAHSGARIVPVDVDRESMLIGADAIADACTPRTAAVVPVHLYGRPVDPLAYEGLARRQSLLVLGDAAQAAGASVGGVAVGATTDAATFSFYPSKNLGALGDGGAIVTTDDQLARRARRLRNYGSEIRSWHTEAGFNSRLDPLQAAFLRVKLRALPRWNARRSAIAERYLDDLADVPEATLPGRAPGVEQCWHVFCLRHPRRDALREHLAAHQIETLVHYPVPPYRSPAFAQLGLRRDRFPEAEAIARTALSLPLGPHMTDASVTRVIEAVLDFGR